jgi:hypothetical protein
MPFDGKSFYCSECGKAGFKSIMAVRGHRSACEGKASVLGALQDLDPSTTSTTTSSTTTTTTSELPSTTSEHLPRHQEPLHASACGAGGGACSECSRLRLELSREKGRSESAVRLATNHLPHLAMGSAEEPGVLGWVQKTWRNPAGRAFLLFGSVLSFALIYELVKSSDVEERKGIRSKVVNRGLEGILKRLFG